MRFRLAANSIGRRDRRVTSLGVGAFAAIVLLCCVQRAVALPLTPFRYEAQAQRHCAGDPVVWLDFRRGRYYRKGQSRYARGFDGSYVCSKEARESGYRRSLFGLR
ncbi:hypothetical protein CK489_36690 [Bradyrhizobium sp. UFLA03-84]|uniref:hypothetical protein n=1 Tax=Bradyrhizobium sp. UFLA03-84 TaxID=418599 RepID=UPI000BAE014E|nr:hypothetical protein [Bradyrhizobium sp. UFLA03-84]PAY03839.1 hypothetical protein CK489_36690 [Bradyrhizobium sp. UFLA03-84]